MKDSTPELHPADKKHPEKKQPNKTLVLVFPGTKEVKVELLAADADLVADQLKTNILEINSGKHMPAVVIGDPLFTFNPQHMIGFYFE